MANIPDTRRAVQVHGDGSITVEEIPMPELGPREVVVRTAVSLISAGTETNGIRGRRATPAPDAPPRTTGYSTAGTIVALGEEATQFEIGQRVIGMAGECYPHADYNVGHPMVTVPIPDGVVSMRPCHGLPRGHIHACAAPDPELGCFTPSSPGSSVADQLITLGRARRGR